MTARNATAPNSGSPSAPVNRIIPLSTVDGPGARTAIFLQGCNIACLYCHNPETQNTCNACGACVELCPTEALLIQGGRIVWDEAQCAGCDNCIRVCPHNASPKVTQMTAAQVMQQIEPNLPFIRGITVSGGECTLYPDFLTALFTLAKQRGLSCLLDSNGTVPLEPLGDLLAVTDGVMLDVKAWDAAVYAALTGEPDNQAVKRNLRYLSQHDKLAELRIVYVPGMVDAKAAIDGMASLLEHKVSITRLKLTAFRCFGVRGQLAGAPSPTQSEMQNLRDAAKRAGFVEVTMVL